MFQKFNAGEEIIAGIKDVFSTMLMVELESGVVYEDQPCPIQSNLTSIMGFGGGVRGMLAIHCPAEVAQRITGAFLGVEKQEIDEEVKDAIGEIANMVAGNLKASYAKSDIDVVLALPTSIVGESFVVTGGMANATRVVVPLNMDAGRFWVELLYVVNS